MRKTRVLLLDLKGMVADIVRQILSEQGDVEVVATLHNVPEGDLIDCTEEVDLVITAHTPNRLELRRFDAALASNPGLRVLAIEDDGRSACMYALAPQTIQLGPLSPKALVEFVRASTRGVEVA